MQDAMPMILPPLDDRPLTDDERDATLDRVHEILELTYRNASLGNFADPLEETVYILLSRQTQEIGYQRAHRTLRERWPSWLEVLHAPANELSDVLRPAGFGPTRAKQLQALLGEVQQACQARGLDGELTLNWLADLSDADAEAFLTALPGIGAKSARCVMHYAMDRKTIAVDTHVRRVLDRLGLVPDRGGKVKHSDYDEVVPPRLRQKLHVNLIHHGRKLCRSTRPRCAECPLISFCPTGRGNSPAPTRPVAVELFAGGGGLGEGFVQGGFAVAVAVELDRSAAQSYRVNHPGTVVIEADAMSVTAEQLVRLVPWAAKPAATIGGPPCQGYSIAGKREAGDRRNDLFQAVVNLAIGLESRFVAIENVPAMRDVGGTLFSQHAERALDEAGYATAVEILRACDFGVPQLRRRLIFLAQRKELGPAPQHPAPTHCAGAHCEHCTPDRPCGLPPTPTVLEALAGLPLLAAGQVAEYLPLSDGRRLLNGSTMAHGPAVLAKISRIVPGAGPISYRRLHRDLARTIVAGHRALPVHPVLHRTISVREAARIQGFPDRHVFAGTRSRQPLQVANAVPPPMGKAIAEGLKKLLGTAPKTLGERKGSAGRRSAIGGQDARVRSEQQLADGAELAG
jgi:DNA (cytosine-5)-methyltransferase 1